MLQIIVFQIQWWLCVLHHYPYFHYGYIAAFSSAFLMVFFTHRSYKKIMFIGLLAVIGVLNDMALVYLNVFVFPGVWLIALWFCFSAWFFDADWINKRYVFCAVAFMIAGPLSYFAGAKFGAITFSQLNIENIVILAVDWFLLGLIFVRTNSLKKRYC